MAAPRQTPTSKTHNTPRRAAPHVQTTDHMFAGMPDGSKRYIAAKPVARFVPDLTKTAFQKFGFASVGLVSDWANIVGAELAGRCFPERLKWPRGKSRTADDCEPAPSPGATLVLRTDAAHALDIQYASAQIIERINAYFGYRAVATLKLVQGPLPAMDQPSTPAQKSNPTGHGRTTGAVAAACSDAIAEIDDDGLKAALNRMRQSIFADP